MAGRVNSITTRISARLDALDALLSRLGRFGAALALTAMAVAIVTTSHFLIRHLQGAPVRPGSVVNLVQSFGDHQRLYSASLIVVLAISGIMLFLFCRIFALKAKDRAIRAEENLRHFSLTGKLLDSKLGVLQVVALRFAPDAEFVVLARRAADEGLAPDAIKRAIKHWRPDLYRV